MNRIPATKFEQNRQFNRNSAMVLALIWIGSQIPATYASDTPVPKELQGKYAEEVVFEGVGIAGVEFGDSSETVEEILGEAEGGSESDRRYTSSGFTIRLQDNLVNGFDVASGFRGKLEVSRLGIGDTLDRFVAAYGEIKATREVENLGAWQLNQTLLRLREEPVSSKESASKIAFYDAGLWVEFDREDRALRLGLFKHTGYAYERGINGQPAGRFIAEPVDEAGMFAGVRFGDTVERAIEILGQPNARNNYFLRYPPSRFSLHVLNGKIDGFLFQDGFRGKLLGCGLGMGNTVEELDAVFNAMMVPEAEVQNGRIPNRKSFSKVKGHSSDLVAQFHVIYPSGSMIFSINDQNKVSAFRIFTSRRD